MRPVLDKKRLWSVGCVALGALAVFGAPAVGVATARRAEAPARASASAGATASASPSPSTEAPPRADFAGVLLPPRMANLAPKAEGRVDRVLAKVGQKVKQGDVLLRLDPRDQKHALAMARAVLRGAKAHAAGASSEMLTARRRAARRDASVEVNGKRIAIVSAEEAAQSQSDARTASARAAAAGASIAEGHAKVQAIELALEETEIRAPFDGVVTALYFESGMSVKSGETVARMVGGDGLRVRLGVGEEDAVVLKDRRRVRVDLDGASLFATIDRVSPEVEPASRTFVLEGVIDGGERACGPSGCAMFAGRAVRTMLLRANEK